MRYPVVVGLLLLFVVGGLFAQEKEKTFYPDGQLRSVGATDAQERPTGKWVYYHPNGKKQREGSYVRGKASGSWKEWYDNGQLKITVSFAISGEEGLKNGSFRYYHSNGKLARSGSYSYGRKVGTWKDYDEEGTLIVPPPEKEEDATEEGQEAEETEAPE